jgi:trans-aconitate 2-methyltransferase
VPKYTSSEQEVKMTEWNAQQYARISGLQQAMAAEALSLLHLKGIERVLDLGCGNGKIAAEIAARVPRGSVIGVDVSADMIAFASHHFGPAVWPNIRFETGDARSLPFQEEFDVVVSFNALHWIAEQDLALRSIRAALKHEGLAQLRLVPVGRRKSIENVLEETRRSPAWACHFQKFRDPYLHLTPEQYGALAERSGLRVLGIHTADKAWDFETRSAFVAFGLVTMVEWTKFLPESDRLAFVSDVLNRYREVASNHPGEENTFKFYQMDVTLSAEARA